MNPHPNIPSLPLVDSSAESPFPPRTPNPYMSKKILITALIALVIIVFFIAAYRLYVYLFWRRRRPSAASWRRNQGELSTTCGLDKAIVDSLPTFTYANRLHHDEKGGAECAVCLVEFQDDDACRLLPKCNHSFHTECIDKWFVSNTTCPMCRMHAEMVEAGKIYQVESTTACLLPHEDIDGQIMPGLDSSLYGQTESSSHMQRPPRSRSTECISLHRGITNDMQRTRSISLFSGERDEAGLGLHMRQILARTFSSRANGTYDIVGVETHIDIDKDRGNTPASNPGSIGEGDVAVSDHSHPSMQHLPHWQRSASDKCLHMRQGLQYPTNVLVIGDESLPTSSLSTGRWQIGGRSLSHINISMEEPKLQDGSFHLCSASSSPLRPPQRTPSPLAGHKSSRVNSLKLSHREESA
ncbi:hypothetical protein GOP47_0024254 [Adiantum capillus-veneris]|uniref:RING-type E3 ubiquitin transferase n=1 Tax=Adiantum capillus-veneris TaxID=13818 RepID=A0A9D4Z574_ADICA|nr:hypothetical protein GOP47_0024254 [Adiantum capillus-veneris]